MSDIKQYTFIDFFSGIGGFRLGLEMAGMKCIGFCEKDKFAVRSYRAMYDTEGEWYGEDITKLRTNEIPRADIWTAGSPCQNLSIAGRRSGLHGDRSGLFFDFVDLLKGKKEEDKPEWVILENVKGLLSSNGGWDFLEYINQLAKAGYDVEWQIFNSKDYGVPQNRERVYTIGHLRSRGGREILPIGSESHGNLKQVIAGSQGNRVYDPTGVSVSLTSGSGGLGAKTGLYLIDQSTSAPKITEEARCITARYTAGATKRTAMNSAVLEIAEECNAQVNKVYPVLTPERLEKRQNGRRIKNSEEPMFTLTSQDRHGVMIEFGEEERMNSDQDTDEIVTSTGIKLRNGTKLGYQIAYPGDSVDLAYPASTTRRARVGQGFAHALSCSGAVGVVVWNNKLVRIRRLTPRECFRLQGFPDDLFDKAAEVNSDTQLYKQAGNGVTVNVVYAIGRKIVANLDS
ncbi:DNA cytosine methyltransferase [Oceanobacillus massiliensis]|uniref:DNA cytosine methyltransferase n=1 Tax=Oceanobacillus massiliensis TaxID=1465765 RepID=UPI000289A2EE|nr:DNA (cytosine-5-)-methyltransferase [Oceanobacillus massiliensis]